MDRENKKHDLALWSRRTSQVAS